MDFSIIMKDLSFIILILQTVMSAKILVTPVPQGSHFFWMANVAQTMFNRGHEVTVLTTPDRQRDPKLNGLSLLTYKVNHKGFKSTEELVDHLTGEYIKKKFGESNTPWEFLSMLQQFEQVMTEDGRQLLMYNTDVINQIKAEKFDLLVTDGNLFTAYFYLIAYKFDIPYVSISSGWDYATLGVPLFPLVPHQMAEYSNRMTWTERLRCAATLLVLTACRVFIASPINDLLRDFAPEKPYKPIYQIQSESRLFLMYIAPPVGYPRATLPHVIPVSALGIKHPQPISDPEIREFIQGATEGFILVSLGSWVNAVPSDVNEKFLQAFRQMKQRVIWKSNGKTLKDVPENVLLLPWLPQNDLLADPSIKLVMTHCGNNGQQEALYHAVPLLGVPVYADQIYNSIRHVTHGYSLSINLLDFTVEEMVSKMREVISNPQYKRKASWASAIMKDDPLLPAERASFWIEHVIKFGSDHLRSPALDLPWYQYYALDFFLCLSLLIVAIGVSCMCLLRCCFRYCVSKYIVKIKEKKA